VGADKTKRDELIELLEQAEKAFQQVTNVALAHRCAMFICRLKAADYVEARHP
jgi:hypothetical protein